MVLKESMPQNRQKSQKCLFRDAVSESAMAENNNATRQQTRKRTRKEPEAANGACDDKVEDTSCTYTKRSSHSKALRHGRECL